MIKLRNALREDIHFRVLRLLENSPDLTQRELAEAVGISNGSAHYVLAALVGAGLVTVARFATSGNRRSRAYVLTPSGLAEKAAVTRQFLARKLEEYDALRAEIETLRADLDDKPKH